MAMLIGVAPPHRGLREFGSRRLVLQGGSAKREAEPGQ
jgi:hypothetical protein